MKKGIMRFDEEYIWSDARVNQSRTITIDRESVLISGGNRIEIAELPYLINEFKRKTKMYSEIYKEWENTFSTSTPIKKDL